MKKSVLTLIFAALALFASAQSRQALRINEVMVVNDSSMVDEYGNHVAWIELFNSNFAPLQISSIYLTNDKYQPKKYPVPLGDVNTKIPKRQHVVFFADGEPNRGTFHTNFTLVPGQDNWIGIYDADGTTLIDEVIVPASLLPNQSWARTADGEGEWAVRTGGKEDYITPSSANIIKDTNNKIDLFAEQDENGFGMTITAMGIVFSALLLLCICFYIINKIGASRSQIKKMEAHGMDRTEVARAERPEGDSGEVIAAICMALNEHLNAHDLESAILTINRGRKTYSPWNSHIYTLRQNPRK